MDIKNSKVIKTKLIILFTIIATLINIIKVNAQTWNIGYPDATKVTATLSGNTLIIKGTGDMKHYPGYKTWHNMITSVHIENGITNIGHSAFYDCHQLKSVSISDSVKSIGDSSFKNCYNLEDVIIPNAVTVIKKNAFEGCKSLKSIVIPNNVIRIEEYAFFECFKLNNIALGNSVNQIGDNTFRACQSLSSITIPKSTTRIGDVVFRECYNLKNIEVERENMKYSSIKGVLFNKNQDTLVAYPNGKIGEYIIPQSISVIENSAFACSKINSISIPNTVNVIGGDAFRYCRNLKNVKVPNSVTEIGVLTFANCDSLIGITLGSGIANLSMYIFSENNSLLEINVDRNNLKLRSKKGILYNKNRDTLIMCPKGKMGEFIVPGKVRCIKKGAFEGCQALTEITISKRVTCIEDLAFQYNRNLKKVKNRSRTPQPISEEVFSYVKLKTLSLFVPKKVIHVYKNTPVWKDFGEIGAIE